MNERGVTLLELTISVTLVSLLAASGLLALRVGLNAMDKSNARLLTNRRAIGAQRALEGQIEGFMPIQADCVSAGPNQPRTRISFFQGDPDTMRFVSSYSLEEGQRGRARILEYVVAPGDEGRGVRLIVNEYLYTGSASAGRFCLGLQREPEGGLRPQWLPPSIGGSSFVLADKLAYCRFTYREPVPGPPFERWTPRASGRVWPTAVRVEMQRLDARPNQLPALNLTVPLRAQKMPDVDYSK